MNKSILIDKVLSGEASLGEQQELQEWIDSDSNHKKEFDDLKKFRQSFADNSAQVDDASFYNGLHTFGESIRKIKIRKRMIRSMKRMLVSTLFSISTMTIMAYSMEWPPFHRVIYYDLQLVEDVIYTNSSYDSIFNALERKYKITIQRSSSDKTACHFTGSFSKGYKVDQLIRVITIAAGLDLTTPVPGHYIVTGKGCRVTN